MVIFHSYVSLPEGNSAKVGSVSVSHGQFLMPKVSKQVIYIYILYIVIVIVLLPSGYLT